MNKELISQAIPFIDLVDIRLNSGALTRDDDFDEFSNVRVKQQSKLSLSATVMKPEDETVDVDLARVKIEFGGRFVQEAEDVSEKSEESDLVLAEVVAEFLVTYTIKNGVSDEALNEFFKFNAVHNAWPFWREHILRVTSMAGLPKFIVPLNKKLTEDQNDKDQ